MKQNWDNWNARYGFMPVVQCRQAIDTSLTVHRIVWQQVGIVVYATVQELSEK